MTQVQRIEIVERRHWRTTYPDNLKRAYFITIGLTVLVLLVAFGYAKGKNLLQNRAAATAKSRVVSFTYAQLGPPPSLTGEEIVPTGATSATPSAPTVGIPKPVPDAEAQAETSTPQAELGGASPLTGMGTGTGVVVQVDTSIPAYGTYVPHNVKPQLMREVKPEYPESAKLLGIEGTTYLQLLLDLNGGVMRVVVAKGSGNASLDTAAVTAGYKLGFTPAKQGEKAVRVWVGLPMKFTLEKR